MYTKNKYENIYTNVYYKDNQCLMFIKLAKCQRRVLSGTIRSIEGGTKSFKGAIVN